MVDLKVLPSNGLPGNYVIWRRKEGRRFALKIGQRRRNLITRFIVGNCIDQTSIHASLCLLDRIRPRAAFNVVVDGIRKVAFVFEQFFILIKYDLLKKKIQESVGHKIFEKEEIFDAIFTETSEDED